MRSSQKKAQEKWSNKKNGVQVKQKDSPSLANKIIIKKDLPKCNDFSFQVNIELNKLFSYEETIYDRIERSIDYWLGNQPIADFPICPSQEYIKDNIDLFRRAQFEYQEFSYNFYIEHREISCHKGFGYLSKMTYYQRQKPEVFKALSTKFLKDKENNEPCDIHNFANNCPKLISYSDIMHSYINQDFDIAIITSDSSILIRDQSKYD